MSKWIRVKVVDNETPFTTLYERGEVVYMPVAHGEGRYIPWVPSALYLNTSTTPTAL